MKRNIFVLFFSMFSILSLHAQWTSESGVVHTNNNVGIGTDNPEGPFEIRNALPRIILNSLGHHPRIETNNRNILIFSGNDDNYSGPVEEHLPQYYRFYPEYDAVRNSSAVLEIFGQQESGWSNVLRLTHDGTNGIIGTNNGNLSLNAPDDLIFTGRNMGIGTNTPTSKLDINGWLTVGNNGDNSKIIMNAANDVSAEIGVQDDSNIGTGLYFRTNNSYRMNISESGNVGIGTTKPNTKLDLRGWLTVGNNGDNSKIIMNAANDVSAEIGVQDDAAVGTGMYFRTDDEYRMNISESGNVGIGILKPKSKLHVDGALRLESATNESMRLMVDNAGNLNVQRDDGDMLMTINDNTGKVGIGTTHPSGKLEILHNASTSNPHIELVENEASGYTRIHMTNIASGNRFSIDANPGSSNPYMNFTFKEGNNSNTVMRIDGDNHRVGIGYNVGTIPAGYRLAVDGKLKCREVRVTNSGWADFVFEDDYELPALEEVEQFIEDNNHLPDVPSAADVLENGTDLGEIDAILLQKIEELTLYMIELNSENKALKERIKNLEQ